MRYDATILQIDDNEDIIQIGKHTFTQAGYQFISARTASEGFQKALSEKPSVIILDYNLNDMCGTDFIKKLATLPEYRAIRGTPTIILSGNAEFTSDLESCYTMGLNAFLKKPFGYRELVNIVENIIQREKIKQKNSARKKGESKAGIDSKKCSEWLKEVQMSAETLAGLSREVYKEKEKQGTEKVKMDIHAIYNSSRRLLKLIKEGEILLQNK